MPLLKWLSTQVIKYHKMRAALAVLLMLMVQVGLGLYISVEDPMLSGRLVFGHFYKHNNKL